MEHSLLNPIAAWSHASLGLKPTGAPDGASAAARESASARLTGQRPPRYFPDCSAATTRATPPQRLSTRAAHAVRGRGQAALQVIPATRAPPLHPDPMPPKSYARSPRPATAQPCSPRPEPCVSKARRAPRRALHLENLRVVPSAAGMRSTGRSWWCAGSPSTADRSWAPSTQPMPRD